MTEDVLLALEDHTVASEVIGAAGELEEPRAGRAEEALSEVRRRHRQERRHPKLARSLHQGVEAAQLVRAVLQHLLDLVGR